MATRCGHPTDDGPCDRRVPDDADACFMHDGAGPPPGHGAPPRNDNAVGNSGGGAPPLNTNAQIHGAFSDTGLVEERLSGAAEEQVERLTDSLIERSRESRPEMDEDRRRRLAREAAVLRRKWLLAVGDTFDAPDSRGIAWRETDTVDVDGETVEVKRHVVNPAFHQQSRISRRRDRLYDTLGVYPTFDEDE